MIQLLPLQQSAECGHFILFKPGKKCRVAQAGFRRIFETIPFGHPVFHPIQRAVEIGKPERCGSVCPNTQRTQIPSVAFTFLNMAQQQAQAAGGRGMADGFQCPCAAGINFSGPTKIETAPLRKYYYGVCGRVNSAFTLKPDSS